MKGKRILTIILIIGIALIIIGPILGFTLDQMTVTDQKPGVITETSDTEIQSAFASEFTIGRNQKATIVFGVYYSDITANLKILTKYEYDAEYTANSNPNGVTGEYFITTTFRLGQNPSVSRQNVIAISNQGETYLEFTGSATATPYFISIPGTYVVIVYGDNAGPDPEVYFNILVKVDGPGGFLNTLFITIGIIVLVCYALFLAYKYLNKMRRER
ncbi:MAG: hypothetical protein ACFE8M_03945 [Candidatus Hermodarchaeota archaeon]